MRALAFAASALALGALVSLGAATASAAPPAPEQFVKDSLDRLSRQLNTSGSDNLESLRLQVREVVDFDGFAERALGERWSTLKPEERQSFAAAMRDLLESRYMSAPKKVFDKNRIAIKSAKMVGKDAEVLGAVKQKDVDIEVVLKLRPKGESWLVYDVVIDGLSLLDDYRAQFDAFLKKKPLSVLTDKLRAKAAQGLAKKSG